MKLRLPLTILAALSAGAAIAQDVTIDFENVSAGNIIGQNGWTSASGTAVRVVDDADFSPEASSTKSHRAETNAAATRYWRNFSGTSATPVTLDKNAVYQMWFDYKGEGIASTLDQDFLWQRMQFMPQNAAGASQTTAFGIGALNRADAGFVGFFPLTIQYNPDNATVGLSAWNVPMAETEWYRLVWVFNNKTKQVTGPVVIQISGTPSIEGLIAVTNDFNGVFDENEVRISTFDTTECVRFGFDAYDPGIINRWDNINFAKTAEVKGKLKVDTPTTASPYLGDQTLNGWILFAFDPLPGTDLQDFEVFTTDADGDFSTVGYESPAGGTDFYVSGGTWLSKAVYAQTVGAPGTSLDLGTIQLYNGDINGDDAITTDDYLDFNLSFDLDPSDPAFNANADLNGDGFVTTDDYLIFSENFGVVETGDLLNDGR